MQAIAGPHGLWAPGVRDTVELLLGHPPAIEFVSVMASWPGAEPQQLHRDADAGHEAALLVFIPLEPMELDSAGPPELCPGTHFQGVPETDCSRGSPVQATPAVAPVGCVRGTGPP